MLTSSDIDVLLQVQEKTREIEGLRTELQALAQDLRLAQTRKAVRNEEMALRRREEALARLRKELLVLENRVHTLTHEIEGLEKKAAGDYAKSHRTLQEIVEKTRELREEKTLREKELADRTIQAENLERSIQEQRERLDEWAGRVQANEERYVEAEEEMGVKVTDLESQIEGLTAGVDEAVASEFLQLAARSQGVAIAHVVKVVSPATGEGLFCSGCHASLPLSVRESLGSGVTRCSWCRRYLVP